MWKSRGIACVVLSLLVVGGFWAAGAAGATRKGSKTMTFTVSVGFDAHYDYMNEKSTCQNGQDDRWTQVMIFKGLTIPRTGAGPTDVHITTRDAFPFAGQEHQGSPYTGGTTYKLFQKGCDTTGGNSAFQCTGYLSNRHKSTLESRDEGTTNKTLALRVGPGPGNGQWDVVNAMGNFPRSAGGCEGAAQRFFPFLVAFSERKMPEMLDPDLDLSLSKLRSMKVHQHLELPSIKPSGSQKPPFACDGTNNPASAGEGGTCTQHMGWTADVSIGRTS